MKRIILYILLGATVVLVAFFLRIHPNVSETLSGTPVVSDISDSFGEAGAQKTIPVQLVVEGVSYDLRVPLGSSVYDVMKQARETRGLEFQGRDFSGIGYFVEEINGKRQDLKVSHFWILYMNGQKAKAGVSSSFVNNQDIIEWKYEDEI